MIYITGDTHGNFTRFSNKKLRKQGMQIYKKRISNFLSRRTKR